MEDTYPEWTPKLDSESDDAVFTRHDENVDFDYKQKTVEFWKSGMKKSNLELSAVQHRFRKVKSVHQLRRWAGQVNKGGTYMEKLHRIAEYTLNNFKSAIDAGMIIHDVNLQKWGLHAKNILGFEETRFKASDWWVWKFKRTHRIISRKVNKFITRKTLEDKEKVKVNAENFVNKVESYITEYGRENVYNSDQSGFQLEMHSGRTLAIEGTRQVKCVVQSISFTTHSYTIQPTISADGKLLSSLYLRLTKPSGKFGPTVQETIFQPINVFVAASKSGKLTSGKFFYS